MDRMNRSQAAARLVERVQYNRPSESDVLQKQVRQHNEAFRDRGLRFLRSLLSNISVNEHWNGVKPVLAALNGPKPADAVKLVKPLLSQSYDSASDQFVASQVALLVKKYPFSANEDVATENGTRKFLRGERRNRHMNALSRKRSSIGAHHPLVHNMREWIRRTIGDVPNYKGAHMQTGWGPGSCVGVNGEFTNYGRKLLSDEWTITPSALPYVLTAARRSPMFWELLGMTRMYNEVRVTCIDLETFDARFLARCKFVDYDQVAFVPKDADEYRTISGQPLLNGWYQTGLSMELRLKLRRVGLDLRDQEANQRMAREGSSGGYNPYCTVDLSNASGSIYTHCVQNVVPADWFIALNSLRAPAYRMPGSKDSVKYSGFMSMGNGFCFPLQTLLFASICQAAHEYCGTAPDFRVYGDDIIVRQNEALVVLEVLRHLGFKANLDKTFVFGPFRESCGADWHSGEDVRPVYVDTCLDTLEQRIRLHNAFCRLPNRWAPMLANACVDWFPPFMKSFVRPFAADTDEAIDGRHLHWVGYPALMNRSFGSPAWYGLSFTAKADKEIVGLAGFQTALAYAALQGCDSLVPFAARRETHMRVTRFSHSGNTSNWLPQAVSRFPRYDALVRHALSELSASLTMSPL